MAKKHFDAFVLDSSLTMSWCFHDEANSYADAIAKRFPHVQAVVPALWHLEVANAFIMGERRHRSTHADTANWTALLSSLPIRLDDQTEARAWSDTLTLARTQNLSVYDAAYLELALRLALPLATLDGRLKTAAAAVGVSLYQP